MTKAENRAAAKAYQQDKERKWRKKARAHCFATKVRPQNTALASNARFANGWLVLHESGTFVTFTQTGADLFA
jgi:hypothetical protein